MKIKKKMTVWRSHEDYHSRPTKNDDSSVLMSLSPFEGEEKGILEIKWTPTMKS